MAHFTFIFRPKLTRRWYQKGRKQAIYVLLPVSELFHLHGTKREDLKIFAAETKRAEMTHWLLILPAPLFFLWNPVWAGWINIAYALFANIPFIMTQRYNRGRIETIVGLSDHGN